MTKASYIDLYYTSPITILTIFPWVYFVGLLRIFMFRTMAPLYTIVSWGFFMFWKLAAPIIMMLRFLCLSPPHRLFARWKAFE